ncbi:hypothetical protein [Clostridium sporogenes]|nr:hypothetical protein [Clostridium sporogenes]
MKIQNPCYRSNVIYKGMLSWGNKKTQLRQMIFCGQNVDMRRF